MSLLTWFQQQTRKFRRNGGEVYEWPSRQKACPRCGSNDTKRYLSDWDASASVKPDADPVYSRHCRSCGYYARDTSAKP